MFLHISEASPNNLIELEPSMNKQDMLQMQSNIETLEQIESKTGQLEVMLLYFTISGIKQEVYSDKNDQIIAKSFLYEN